MHEFLRQYGAAKLAEDPDQERAARDRHCAYYAVVLEQRLAMLDGPRHNEALDELRLEMRNIQAACDWAGQRAHRRELASGDEAERLARMCQMLDSGRQIIRSLLPQSLAAPATPTEPAATVAAVP
jgi:hypothetical protein